MSLVNVGIYLWKASLFLLLICSLPHPCSSWDWSGRGCRAEMTAAADDCRSALNGCSCVQLRLIQRQNASFWCSWVLVGSWFRYLSHLLYKTTLQTLNLCSPFVWQTSLLWWKSHAPSNPGRLDMIISAKYGFFVKHQDLDEFKDVFGCEFFQIHALNVWVFSGFCMRIQQLHAFWGTSTLNGSTARLSARISSLIRQQMFKFKGRSIRCVWDDFCLAWIVVRSGGAGIGAWDEGEHWAAARLYEDRKSGLSLTFSWALIWLSSLVLSLLLCL